MKPHEYADKFALIFQQIEAITAKIENTEYKDKREIDRDLAIAIDLGQQYTDTLLEIIEDGEALPLSEYVPMEL